LKDRAERVKARQAAALEKQKKEQRESMLAITDGTTVGSVLVTQDASNPKDKPRRDSRHIVRDLRNRSGSGNRSENNASAASNRQKTNPSDVVKRLYERKPKTVAKQATNE